MLYITTIVILKYSIELNKRKWFPSPNMYEIKDRNYEEVVICCWSVYGW